MAAFAQIRWPSYSCMKTTPHTIEIDAQAAFRSIGVDFKINPFAKECTAALKELIEESINAQMLATALAVAAGGKRKRRRKSSTQPSASSVPQTGGQSDERKED